jgi:hypothetical protein
LLPDSNLADIAVWADQQVADNTQTGPWHYVNLRPIRRLTGLTGRPALKFLVHFVGDLQPFHALDVARGSSPARNCR